MISDVAGTFESSESTSTKIFLSSVVLAVEASSCSVVGLIGQQTFLSSLLQIVGE